MSDLIKKYTHLDGAKDIPPLIDVQKNSYEVFKREGLVRLFDSVFPTSSVMGNKRVYFPSSAPGSGDWDLKFRFEPPQMTIKECVRRGVTYSSNLYTEILIDDGQGTMMKKEVFFGQFPEITPGGTFIINGIERVVVLQMLRSPGPYFSREVDRITGDVLVQGQIVPMRGSWVNVSVEPGKKGSHMVVRFDRAKGIPATTFLRVVANFNDGLFPNPVSFTSPRESIFSMFDEKYHPIIKNTLARERWKTADPVSRSYEALGKVLNVLRPNMKLSPDKALEYILDRFYSKNQYNLSVVGRERMLRVFGDRDIPHDFLFLSIKDIVSLFDGVLKVFDGNGDNLISDVDSLGNKIIRGVGDLLESELYRAFRNIGQSIAQKLDDPFTEFTPNTLVNPQPIDIALKQFFNMGQLSQYMDQTNPLSSMRHKRTVSVLGPGGLTRDNASIDTRDVHHTHFGRICPIETPEGGNIGLVTHLALYAQRDRFGFLRTPYYEVKKLVSIKDEDLVGRSVREDIVGSEGSVILAKGGRISSSIKKKIKELLGEDFSVPVTPFVSDQIVLLTADEEHHYTIGPLMVTNKKKEIPEGIYPSRSHGEYVGAGKDQLELINYTSYQMTGVNAALSPFVSNTDGNRALMASNMMSQAMPIINADPTRVGTGLEHVVSESSSQILTADVSGEVVYVDSGKIKILDSQSGEEVEQVLRKFGRSNQETCINQTPIVCKGDRVNRGEVIADSYSSHNGELVHGQDALIAFASWEGFNFEDSIVLSERVVQQDLFTAITLSHEITNVISSPRGTEEVTPYIPFASEKELRHLDERGLVKTGSFVHPGDILVGKRIEIQDEEFGEETLLRDIFEIEKEPKYKDVSLRVPNGREGTVVEVKYFEDEDDMPLGSDIVARVEVTIAEKMKIDIGDKMSGRHGNKGVVSKIVPQEDMPYMEDGTPVDIVLNPLGVPGRMNIGQILELHLGWASYKLGFRCIVPPFDTTAQEEIEAELARAWMIERAWGDIKEMAWEEHNSLAYKKIPLDDEALTERYATEWLRKSKHKTWDYSENKKFLHRAVLHEWLKEKGFSPGDVLLYEDETVSYEERMERSSNAVITSLQLWLQYQGVENIVSEDESFLRALSDEVFLKKGVPTPILGSCVLRDGMTGEAYDRPIGVGKMTFLRLNHVSSHKIHARDVGPYSATTQQPLKGKAMKGGQRLGEMEVWALEGAGAANTLQEMLTTKSDDILGRSALMLSILKGESPPIPEIPASFEMLVRELESLGVNVEGVLTDGSVVNFGNKELYGDGSIDKVIQKFLVDSGSGERETLWEETLRSLNLPDQTYFALRWTNSLPDNVTDQDDMLEYLNKVSAGDIRLSRFGVVAQSTLSDALLQQSIKNKRK